LGGNNDAHVKFKRKWVNAFITNVCTDATKCGARETNTERQTD